MSKKQGPEGVKWELELVGFWPGKMGFWPLGLGFLTLGLGKKILKIKNGNGFENCKVGFGKNMSWEMGLVPFRTLKKGRVEQVRIELGTMCNTVIFYIPATSHKRFASTLQGTIKLVYTQAAPAIFVLKRTYNLTTDCKFLS
mgnify:CR=1 FL=1